VSKLIFAHVQAITGKSFDNKAHW